MDPASTFGGLFAKPTPRRLLVASPFVAVAFVLVAMAIFFMHVLSAARAYVGGESLWSKAQKQAVQHLERYAQTRSARHGRPTSGRSRCRSATASRARSSKSPRPTTRWRAKA